MTKRRIIALLLALCLCLAGCAGEAESAATPTPEPTVEPTPEPTPAPEPTPTPVPEAKLPGDWYGCWEIFNAKGPWAELDKQRWDCCAEIDSELHMLLWDVDVEKSIGLGSFSILEGGIELGLTDIRFMNVEENCDNWTIKKNHDETGTSLVLRGRYDAQHGGSFSFVIYLRPWGDEWPEGDEGRPVGYESYWLPLLEKGEDMPDSFENYA